MTTILGDDYDPVEVLPLDLVGYLGDKGFVILSSVKNRNRKLPSVEGSVLEFVPLCIRAKVVNNQEEFADRERLFFIFKNLVYNSK